MTTETFPFRHRFTEAVPLARGAEGRLLRVRDNWTGRWGALKVSVDATARQGLLEEFRWLSHLRHPCLIESHDLLEEAGERAHLLEYLPAVDPFGLWDEGGEDAVWAASIQTLRALAYLHRHHVVHGDVTPGNILVWREGSGWRAKLADLGLALPEALAAKAGVRGTPGYWAPEIAAGKGATPASDLYSLAASMYAWIEGRRPWSELAPAHELRHLASLPDIPKPRRRISPELESFLAVLGSSRAEARSRFDWAELRSRSAAWGPPAMVATVSGLEAPVGEWKEWVYAVPTGSAAALVLSGRLGTGRRTALHSLARSLAQEGWMTIWSSPLGVLHDRFAESGSDLDPVVAARELGSRTAGRHLAFLWSDTATDLESRILRAFVAAREDASSDVRTLVLRAAGIEGADEVVEWLRGTSRCRTDVWRGLDREALRAISADLFAAEEGFVRRGESGETPLTLAAMKQAAVQGTGVELTGAEAHLEMERLWERVSVPARQVLSLLAESSLGWEAGELGEALGWTAEAARNHLGELGNLGLIQRTFEVGTEKNLIADALTRQAVLRLGGRYETARMKKLLGDGGTHPGDLELARHFWKREEALPRYTRGCLDLALREGRYDEVLDFAKEAGARPESFGTDAVELWSQFLRAATRLGKYEIEVKLLRQVIAWCEGPQEIAYRKALAQSLTNLGDWKQALEECRILESLADVTDRDRIWAKLQRAETLWQAGQFAEADEVYSETESCLEPEMREEWLRYGVGRARQHGQRGDMAGVKLHLELAETKAGKELCEKEPMYLHTLAGWLIEKSDLTQALPLLQRGAVRAAKAENWASYIMITSREASLTYDLGEITNAARIGRESVATAEALGSRRIISYTNAVLGFAETHLGNIGAAWRRTQHVLDLGNQLGDRNIELLGFRLKAFIASSMGWRSLTEEATARVDKIGAAMEERETIAFAALCRGLFHFADENWREARIHFQKASQSFEEIGQLTSDLKARIYLALLDYSTGQQGRAEDELAKLNDLSMSQKVELLIPIAKLALCRVKLPNEELAASAAQIVLELEAHGRYLDLIEWGTLGLEDQECRNQIRTYMLNAVQRIANSLDDVQLRREFLGFPRTRKALLAIQG